MKRVAIAFSSLAYGIVLIYLKLIHGSMNRSMYLETKKMLKMNPEMENLIFNLIPFKGLMGRMVILNITFFIPLGIISMYVSNKMWKRVAFITIVSSLLEVLQYTLSVGSFDINDILLNIVGGVIGMLIFRAFKGVYNKMRVNL